MNIALPELQVFLREETMRDAMQSFPGPLREPVDRATVDERGEHAQAVPERLAQRRET